MKLGSSKFEEDYNIKLQYYLMNPQSLNSYSYANNNPVIWSDPGGEILPLIAIAGIAWATAEVGLSAYDIYATSEILADENVSAEDKAFTTSLTVAGVFLPGGGYGTAGRGVVKAGKYITKNADSLIQISKSKLQHVVKRHAWNSTENVSTFLKGIDPVKLINKASDSVGSIQKNGNIERIIKSDVSIGYDYLTKKTTDVYTVITKLLKDGKEELVTVFPGLPKP